MVEKLWDLNGLDPKLMPKIIAGDIAHHDLKEMGSYLRNLNGADISLADDLNIVNALMDIAELPNVDKEVYLASREKAHEIEAAKTKENSNEKVGDKSRTSEEDDDKVSGK